MTVNFVVIGPCNCLRFSTGSSNFLDCDECSYMGSCMVLIDIRCGFVSFALDAVIIGASSIKHLEENIKSTKHGPLHEGEFNYSNHFQLRGCTHLLVVFGLFFGENGFVFPFKKRERFKNPLQ